MVSLVLRAKIKYRRLSYQLVLNPSLTFYSYIIPALKCAVARNSKAIKRKLMKNKAKINLYFVSWDPCQGT